MSYLNGFRAGLVVAVAAYVATIYLPFWANLLFFMPAAVWFSLWAAPKPLRWSK